MSTNGSNYDAIVVGSGSVGNPTACFLAKTGLRVLVLERRSASGQGDNKAAIGGVRATHSDPGKILTCIESLKIFSTWQETYGSHIGWKEGGYCFPVYTESIEKLLKGMLPIQKKFGLAIDWVGPDRIAELIPGIAEEGLRGGTFSPHDGQVSPLLAAVAFQREAVRSGAVYHFNEKVTGYTREKNRITGVVTDKAAYGAGTVVLATGADAREHSEPLGIDIPVTPDSHEAGISSPVEQFLGPLVVDLRPRLDALRLLVPALVRPPCGHDGHVAARLEDLLALRVDRSVPVRIRILEAIGGAVLEDLVDALPRGARLGGEGPGSRENGWGRERPAARAWW